MAIGRNMNGAAIGENPGQLIVSHAWPMTDRAGIHVHERRSRSRIESDATALKTQPNLAEFFELHAGDVEIHRLAIDVLAELSDTARSRTQHCVSFRRAIAANDVNRLRRADFAIDLP